VIAIKSERKKNQKSRHANRSPLVNWKKKKKNQKDFQRGQPSGAVIYDSLLTSDSGEDKDGGR